MLWAKAIRGGNQGQEMDLEEGMEGRVGKGVDGTQDHVSRADPGTGRVEEEVEEEVEGEIGEADGKGNYA